MKTILTTLTVLLLFCGFSNNNLYANPSDNMINSSAFETFDKYYPMQEYRCSSYMGNGKW